MKCTIDWLAASGMAFSAETGSGHLLMMDGAPDGGGRNLAPRPMETVLAGTGACTAYDVVLILRRGRHDVRGCRVEVQRRARAARSQGLHEDRTCTSSSPASACRARRSSGRSRCRTRSIARRRIMLAKTAEITTSFEIVDAAAEPRRSVDAQT